MSDPTAPRWLLPLPRAACESCEQRLGAAYFDRDDRLRCEACEAAADRDAASPARLVTAALCGFAAAVASIAGWAAVAYVTRRELLLVAATIGVFIGLGVRAGGSDRGGKRYQYLAAALAYAAIAAAPLVFTILVARAPDPPTGELVLTALTLPLRRLAVDPPDGLLTVLFIVAGVWMAWSINEPRAGLFGPYSLVPGGRSRAGHYTCHACSGAIAPRLLVCPGCGAYRHEVRVRELAEQAARAEREDDRTTALARWRETLVLLPQPSPASDHVNAEMARLEGRTDPFHLPSTT